MGPWSIWLYPHSIEGWFPHTCVFHTCVQFKAFIQCTTDHADYYEPFLTMLLGEDGSQQEEGEAASAPGADKEEAAKEGAAKEGAVAAGAR